MAGESPYQWDRSISFDQYRLKFLHFLWCNKWILAVLTSCIVSSSIRVRNHHRQAWRKVPDCYTWPQALCCKWGTFDQSPCHISSHKRNLSLTCCSGAQSRKLGSWSSSLVYKSYKPHYPNHYKSICKGNFYHCYLWSLMWFPLTPSFYDCRKSGNESKFSNGKDSQTTIRLW